MSYTPTGPAPSKSRTKNAQGTGDFDFSYVPKKSTTKAPNSDYHQIMPPVAARQAEGARDYPKRAARIGELNGHPPGTGGPMATALKGHNGGQVLVFVMGAFAEMSGDVSRSCDISPPTT